MVEIWAACAVTLASATTRASCWPISHSNTPSAASAPAILPSGPAAYDSISASMAFPPMVIAVAESNSCHCDCVRMSLIGLVLGDHPALGALAGFLIGWIAQEIGARHVRRKYPAVTNARHRDAA